MSYLFHTGFLGHAKKARPTTELSPRLFTDAVLIEEYLDYLRVRSIVYMSVVV